MKNIKNIQKKRIIPLLFSLLLLATLLTLPIGNAQEDYREKTTHAYIGATPNPIGVGQQVLLHVGITDYLLYYHHGWEGLTVTVTDPVGNQQTLGPYRTDSTGGTGAVFIPEMVGTYTFQTNFPEQFYTWESTPNFDSDIYGTILYKASQSSPLELVVTEEQRVFYPDQSLPSEYWTRPIDAQLWAWSGVSGNWVAAPDNLYAPHNDAPETAHILWAKDLERGGLAGGMYGPHSYQDGDAYEGKFVGSVIIAGVLYYNRFTEEGRGGPAAQGIVAVDLRTGEELWFKNDTRLAFGQVFYWDSFNYHATFGYLWETIGSTWNAYDIQTGEWVYSMTDVPSGTTKYGPNGQIFRYNVNIRAGWMTLWNSSRVVQPFNSGGSRDGSWQREVGRNSDHIFDATTGIEWNITLPSGLEGSVNAILDDRIIGTTAGGWTGMGEAPIEMWCISIEPGKEGQLLWQKSWQPPVGELSISWSTASSEEGVFTIWAKETRQLFGFSTNTGEKIWGPTQSQHYLGIFDTYEVIAYGKLLSARMAGIVYCYDIQTGNLDWTYEVVDEYTEILWADNWPIRPMFVSDGKIYLGHSEHSPIDPKPRGAPYLCLDIETGDEVWRIDGAFRVTDWGGRSIIGDSVIATMDTYDQRIYAIGKGPTSVSVEAPLIAVPKGSAVTIRGMVTDISPGTEDVALKLRFPQGIPAVADQDMSDWMLYVYKQFERPTNGNGVQVKLEAIDPDGNYEYVGTTTSDMNGLYHFAWKPEIEGSYTIIATFEGSKAYYGSYAETALTVGAVSSATQIEHESSSEALNTNEVVIIAAVAIAAVIGVTAYWMLKRK